MWLERKIMSRSHSYFHIIYFFRVKGDSTYLKLSAEIGWKSLRDSVSHMSDGKFTELVWPLVDEDPDDAFSSVPYEKVTKLIYFLTSIGI